MKNLGLDRRHWIGLIVVLAVGAGLRFHHLGGESFWVDEMFSLQFVVGQSVTQVLQSLAADTHPPLYWLLLRSWINWFGDSEVAVRSLSSLLSIGAVFVVFRIGAAVSSPTVGLVAAALFATSSFSITQAQEGRNYALLALTASLSVLATLRVCRQWSIRAVIGYILATSLLLYSHVYSVFVIFAENAFVVGSLLLFRDHAMWRNIGRWLGLQIGALVCFLPWFFVLLRQSGRVQENFWLQAPTLETLGQLGTTYANGSWKLFPLFAAPLLLLVGDRLLAVFRPNSAAHLEGGLAAVLATENRRLVFIVVVLLVPIVVPFIISLIGRPIFQVKYTAASYFAFCILVARGIGSIRKRQLRIAYFSIMATLATLALLKNYYGHSFAPATREAASYLADTIGPNDIIYACGTGQIAWPFRFYAEKAGLYKRARIVSLEDHFDFASVAINQRIWILIYSLNPTPCDQEKVFPAPAFTAEDFSDPHFKHVEMSLVRRAF